MTTIAIKKQGVEPTVVLLSAGIGNRIKSNEPRALIPYANTTLIEYQIRTISNSFNKCDIIVVCGHESYKINKRLEPYKNVRIVENENYEITGSASSMRLGFNNTKNNRVILIHGDLIFNKQTISNLDYRQSFLLVDNRDMIKEREVGVVISDNECASNMCFGVDTKWCQIAHFTGKELERLRRDLNKNNDFNKRRLTFEVINDLINTKGSFKCYEPEEMQIFELDSMKDFLEGEVNIR
jgi:choline kinase